MFVLSLFFVLEINNSEKKEDFECIDDNFNGLHSPNQLLQKSLVINQSIMKEENLNEDLLSQLTTYNPQNNNDDESAHTSLSEKSKSATKISLKSKSKKHFSPRKKKYLKNRHSAFYSKTKYYNDLLSENNILNDDVEFYNDFQKFYSSLAQAYDLDLNELIRLAKNTPKKEISYTVPLVKSYYNPLERHGNQYEFTLKQNSTPTNKLIKNLDMKVEDKFLNTVSQISSTNFDFDIKLERPSFLRKNIVCKLILFPKKLKTAINYEEILGNLEKKYNLVFRN